MISTSTLLTVLAGLAATPSSVSAVSWAVVDSSCDDDPFTISGDPVKCNGSSTCNLGDTAEVSGTVTATNDFSDHDVTLQVCFGGIYCPSEASMEAGSLSDWLTPTESQEFGKEGAYSVYYTVDIPSTDKIPNDSKWTGFLMMAATVKMIVGKDEECESGGTYQMAYSMSVIPIALLGLYGLAARRRSKAKESEGKDSQFVEMTDSASGVVV